MKKKYAGISVEFFKAFLDYDQETGIFVWKKSRQRIRVGQIAGYKHPRGYIEIQLNGAKYAAHDLAWLFVYGVWPEILIDHKDCNPSNNSIKNLREANYSNNCANRRSNLEFKGVTKRTKNTYSAEIYVRGKAIRLGRFKSPQEAHSAYVEAAKKHFGEFARG